MHALHHKEEKRCKVTRVGVKHHCGHWRIDNLFESLLLHKFRLALLKLKRRHNFFVLNTLQASGKSVSVHLFLSRCHLFFRIGDCLGEHFGIDALMISTLDLSKREETLILVHRRENGGIILHFINQILVFAGCKFIGKVIEELFQMVLVIQATDSLRHPAFEHILAQQGGTLRVQLCVLCFVLLCLLIHKRFE